MFRSLFLSLAQHDVLTETEKVRLTGAVSSEKRVQVGQDIVSIGTRPGHSAILEDGFAARYKLLSDGSRQFTSLQVPGDFVDLHAFLLKKMDHGIVALSPCHVALVDHAELRNITETEPHLTRLLWLDTLVDASIHREWIVAMGGLSKTAHLAHIICELFIRLRVVNLTDGCSFSFPLSQAEIADALGLSVVHTNRVIQGLRREGLIRWTNHTICILEWDRLKEFAEFDPTYLSIQPEPR